MRTDDQRFLDLLQRWQSGDFTRQDEQALRSLTESDDFRREAMEGFMALPETDHSAHLAALRQRLLPEVAIRRVLPMPQIMAIAAALLVLVAAILFFPRAAEKQSETVAQTAAPAPTTPELAPQTSQSDSPASGEIAQSLPRRQSTERPTAMPSQEEPAPIVYQTPAPENRDMALEELSAPAPAATSAAPAAVRPPIADDALPGGPAGNVEKAKMANKPTILRSKKQERESADTLAWNDTEKKSDLDRLRKEVRADQLGPAQSEPADGWSAFSEYLRQSARLPQEARDRNVSGTVRLQFTVNANGEPQNFVVLRSLGQSCDDEAKRLVQNWGWVRGQNPVVTVEIKFVR